MRADFERTWEIIQADTGYKPNTIITSRSKIEALHRFEQHLEFVKRVLGSTPRWHVLQRWALSIELRRATNQDVHSRIRRKRRAFRAWRRERKGEEWI